MESFKLSAHSPSRFDPPFQIERDSLLHRRLFGVVVFSMYLLFFTHFASSAQSGGATGTLVGTVLDSAGAAIPGAAVTVTEIETGVAQKTVTTSAGSFTVPSLKPGTYSVSAIATGFSSTLVNNVQLTVGSQQRVDVKLNTGSSTESVSVSAQNIGLDTENAAIGQVVTGKEIVDLPLNGRNFTQLLLLNSGAVANSGEQGSLRANEGPALTIQGARPSSNQYFLDGININDTYYQVPAVIPSIDVIQEFQEQTKGYSAAYGGGANQLNLSTRSGTNTIHGTAFDFFRNDALDAKGYFASGRKPPLRQNQFGYVLSGPILIPHLYDGHNRSFFLANYEGLRSKTSSILFANVPTLAQKQGVFNNTIVDPTTKVPYANNTIPMPSFSQLALNSLSHFPDPNISSARGNYTTVLTLPTDSDQQTYRFDQSVGTKDSFFVRYSQTTYANQSTSIGGVFAEGVGIFTETAKNLAASYTHIFTPRLLNQLRFGLLREGANSTGVQTTQAAYTALGLKNIYPYSPDLPFPYFAFRNNQYSSAGGDFAVQEFTQNTYSISDAVTASFSRHTVSFGMDTRWWHTVQNNPGPPQFTFDGSGTGVPAADGGIVAGTGDSFADYLVGYVAQATAITPTPFAPTVATSNQVAYNFRYFAPWIQDDWKISPRLTLNAGLRYDFMKKPYEDQDRVFWLDPNIIGGGLFTANKSIIDQGIGGSLYSYGGERNPGQTQKNVFAPRLGVAYRPTTDERTVIRAGYGVFFDTAETKEAYDGGGYPFSTNATLMNVSSANLFPSSAGLGPVTSAQLGFLFIQTANVHTPNVQDWQLSVEREVIPGTKAELDYLGSKGTHLLGRVWENAPHQYDPAHPTPVSARVPYPNIGLILDHYWAFHSSYNALQAKLEHSGKLYSYIVGYTYSHSLDDKSGTTAVNGDTSGNGPQNQYNFAADYGSSSFDITHNFVGSFTASAPVGRGKRYLSSVNLLTDALVGGWQANGIVSLRTGFPFSIAATDIGFLNQGFGQRADLVGRANPSGFKRTAQQAFNTAAFAQPAVGAYGNSARNSVRAPSANNVDASLFKTFHVIERVNLQTRFEAFNLFNHTNFAIPDNSINSPTYGVERAASPGRILQVAAKVTW